MQGNLQCILPNNRKFKNLPITSDTNFKKEKFKNFILSTLNLRRNGRPLYFCGRYTYCAHCRPSTFRHGYFVKQLMLFVFQRRTGAQVDRGQQEN
jgi:hypothetical protein